MKQPALEALAVELGGVAGAIEREARLRVDALLADLARKDAERELRVVQLERRLEERLAALKDGEPGRSVTAEECAPLIEAEVARQVAALPPAEPGKSITAEEVEPMLRALVEALPAAEPGRSVTAEECAPLIEAEVARQVAALPPAEAGKSVTVEDVEPMLRAMVDALPPAEPGPRGEQGPEGRLPAIKAWGDRVHYEGEVVSHAGATWQAAKDTGRAPPHEDWTCLAAAGRHGDNGRSPAVRGTYAAEGIDYSELDIVVLNGGAFIAKRDNPGACPGEGWQLLAAQGKRGQPGEPGKSVKGDRGPAGPPVQSIVVDDQGLMTLANADGSKVECDLYDLLSSIAR